MRICLGSDWSPSGSKNLLGELKVADLWNRRHMDREFSAEELCAMATRNAADALGWSERLGRLREGLHGDVLVATDRDVAVKVDQAGVDDSAGPHPPSGFESHRGRGPSLDRGDPLVGADIERAVPYLRTLRIEGDEPAQQDEGLWHGSTAAA